VTNVDSKANAVYVYDNTSGQTIGFDGYTKNIFFTADIKPQCSECLAISPVTHDI